MVQTSQSQDKSVDEGILSVYNESRTNNHRQQVERKLNAEFNRINSIMGLDLNLKILWTPRNDKEQLGEVCGSSIIIYEADEEETIKILRHEVIDYIVCEAIKPYQDMTNILIKKINEDAYRKKEKMVNAITQLLEKS